MALEPEPSSSNQNALTYYIFAREVLILEKSCPKKVLNSSRRPSPKIRI